MPTKVASPARQNLKVQIRHPQRPITNFSRVPRNLSQNGRKVTIVSFTIGKYRVNGTINDQNLVELTDTWFPNPVYGDMDYEARYTKYKNFDGVQFPTMVHVHQGDPRLNPAHNYYEYNVTDVKANAPVTTIPVPDGVRTAAVQPVKVESQKLADGLWLAHRRHDSRTRRRPASR